MENEDSREIICNRLISKIVHHKFIVKMFYKQAIN